jgi:hypothetical protein
LFLIFFLFRRQGLPSSLVVFNLFCSLTPRYNFVPPKLLVHNASYTYCIIYVPPKISSRTPGGTRTPGWIPLI